MRACIHRGSNQVGGSCVELESSGQRLVIDFGLPLDAERDRGQYVPDIPGLDGGDPSLLGILISHGHLDHFGLLSHAAPCIPVGMGIAARRILAAAAPFLPGQWPAPARGWDLRSRHSLDIGPFHVTPFLVDHSAYDAYAFLTESGGKSVFYSGDFRAHGHKASLFERFIAHPPTNVNALLLEGSCFGRVEDDQRFPTEREIEAQLVKVFSAATGLALVHTSAQNIDRIVSILRACRRTGRQLVIDLYTAAILEATGNQNIPQSDWSGVALFIPHMQRVQIKKNSWFDLLKRHAARRIYLEDLQQAANRSTLLFRPLYRLDLERGNCLERAIYIYSQWEGYWQRGDYQSVQDWLDRHGIPKRSIHTSGHACIADLKALVAAVAPERVIPIHSFMPERYAQVFPIVEMHNDGEWWEV